MPIPSENNVIGLPFFAAIPCEDRLVEFGLRSAPSDTDTRQRLFGLLLLQCLQLFIEVGYGHNSGYFEIGIGPELRVTLVVEGFEIKRRIGPAAQINIPNPDASYPNDNTAQSPTAQVISLRFNADGAVHQPRS